MSLQVATVHEDMLNFRDAVFEEFRQLYMVIAENTSRKD